MCLHGGERENNRGGNRDGFKVPLFYSLARPLPSLSHSLSHTHSQTRSHTHTHTHTHTRLHASLPNPSTLFSLSLSPADACSLARCCTRLIRSLSFQRMKRRKSIRLPPHLLPRSVLMWAIFVRQCWKKCSHPLLKAI